MRLRVRIRTGLLLVGGMAVLLLYSFVDGPFLRPTVPARRLQIVRITADDIAKLAGNIGPIDPIIHVSLRPAPPPPQPTLPAANAARPPPQPPFLFAPRALQHSATQGNLQYDVSDAMPARKARPDVAVGNVSPQVESVTLPSGWSSSPEVDQTLSARRDHVREVCHKYHLNELSSSNTINAWEFLINPRHKLVWCSIFKAASSTWFYNFNVLAGYSENRLLRAKETPITLARRKYPRPTVSELVNFMNQTERPLSFMIARHPLHRLVSGYRDKLLSGRRYYSNLSRRIVQSNPQLGDNTLVETDVSNAHDIRNKPNSLISKALSKVKQARMILVPTFPQFVQYIIDSNRKGDTLDEHWAPMYKFCSPCLFEFDVIAKMETLDEDGNYIIFKSGIEKIVKPKRINRNKNEPTDQVADSFLCQLSRPMMLDLINMYKMDIELFDYEYEHYINCTTDQVRLEEVR